MKHKLFTLFLALMAGAGTVFAASGTCGDNLTWELNSSGVLTISGSGNMTDWSIRNAPWYSSRSSIKTVKIEYGVTSIGKYAFYECSNISSVTIGSSVTSIKDHAFSYCSSLLSVIIPNSVKSIGDYAFSQCTNIAAVSIGEGITSTGWGTNVFIGCSNLESVVWNAIDGPNAPFTAVRENIRSFTFGGNVQKIPGYICTGMNKLTIITIPSNVTSIGGDAFYGCTGLTSVVWNAKNCSSIPFSDLKATITSFTFGNAVESIPASLCFGMTQLTSVTIPNNVKSIGNYAFSGCTGLTSVTIGNGVTSIGNQAFYNCSGLSSVTIGESVTSMGTEVFDKCTGLKTVVWNAKNCSSAPFSSAKGTITSFTFGNAVESIPNYMCNGMSKLTTITIPNSVTSIGNQVFFNCSGLTSVTIGESVTSIGTDVFYNCSALKTITWNAKNCNAAPFSSAKGTITSFTFGSAVESIPEDICLEMSKLTSITIPTSVTSIGDGAFDNCSGLTSIAIPNNLQSIGEYAFNNCTGLTSATIGTNVTSIGSQAFYGCTGLKTIVWNAKNCSSVNPFASAASSITSFTFGSAVESIPEDLCTNMSKLTSITIPSSVTSIGDGAFYDCSGLTSIVIPDNVQTIGESAFGSCTGLTAATVGSSVTNLGAYAFDGCTGLESITTKATTPPTCGTNCFRNVNKSIPLYVPQGTVAAYKAKDGWKDFGNILLASGTCGDNLTWVLDGDGVLTIKGTGKMTGWVQGKSVPWYDYRASIKSVVIEAGVTSIGSLAFNGYSSITSVTIPAGITNIGSYAFYGCTGLKSITIPDGVTTLDEGAFQACTGFTTITLPASVNTLGENALSGCSGLQSITCEATTPPHCDDECFVGVTKSIPVYVPYGTVSAYNNEDYWNDFTNIQAMKCVSASGTCGASGDNVTWELSCDGVLTISGTGAMKDYWDEDPSWQTYIASIKSVVIESGVTTIGVAAFYSYSKLASVTIGNSVTTIGSYAFYNCVLLTSVTLPNSVTTISKDAFHGTSLKTIAIPANVSTIEAGAFNDCSNLTSIDVHVDNEDYCSEDGILFNENKTILVECPCAKKGAYTIPAGVKIIEQFAFQNCTGLTSLVIPNSVTQIKDNAFNGCAGLKSVTSHATTQPACGKDCFNGITKSIPVYVPAASVEAYNNDSKWSYFTNIQEIGAGQVAYELVDLSKESITEGEYLIVFDDNKAHAKVSGSDLAASSDELTIVGDVAYVPKETACAVTIKPFGTDSFSILLADGKNYLDLQKKNSVTSSTAASKFAITDGGKQCVEIAKYLPSEKKTYILKQNGDFFRMYNSTTITTLPKLYRKKISTFTVTWKMDDGSTIAEETYAYGETPSRENPVKEATAQYTYAFKEWSPAIAKVTADVTYTAVFIATERSYTVTWQNWDGSQLAQETYKYGVTPSYKGAEPTRPATAENTFTFNGWSPDIESVTGDATYKAQFSSTGQTYTVTWKMDDGSQLAQETYAYGDMPNYTAPTKEATAQYTYAFKNWSPAIVAVSADATYTAVFEATLRSYTVKFVDWDGKELKSEDVEYNKAATAPKDPARDGYKFTGWDKAFDHITADLTVTAQYEEIDYTPTNLNVNMIPQGSDVQIALSWNKVEGVPSYELRLAIDEEELLVQNTMGLNAVSKLLSEIEKTYSIPAGTYTMNWAVRSTDVMGKAVSGWAEGPQFEITIKGPGSDIETANSQEPKAKSQKILRNGVMYILRDGKAYTVTGQEVIGNW